MYLPREFYPHQTDVSTHRVGSDDPHVDNHDFTALEPVVGRMADYSWSRQSTGGNHKCYKHVHVLVMRRVCSIISYLLRFCILYGSFYLPKY
jgi:hypothetical protein